MADLFYDLIVLAGRTAFVTSSDPVVLGAHHTRRHGPFLLAATHASPYDVPILMRHAARRVDFVSSTEVFSVRPVAWFYGSMNAFPLDRSRPDTSAVRTIYDRLKRGRVVGIFPEGGFRRGAQSVVHTRRIRPGIGRLARSAGVPIVPAVIVGAEAYSSPTSWLPLRAVRYGLSFGDAIPPDAEPADIEATLVDRFVTLHRAFVDQMTSRTRRQTSR